MLPVTYWIYSGMAKKTSKTNPARTKRDLTIAQDRIGGLNYREIAKIHGLSAARICQILKDEEIKEIVDQGQTQAITMIPLANQVYFDRLTDPKEKLLQFKAAQDIKKMAGILPSNITNQRITNVYNQHNNITLQPGVAEILAKALKAEDPGIIDVSPEETDGQSI